MQLKINPEFKNIIPPLLPDEYAGLEASLLEDGCRDALVIWNDTIVDGHNRYEICSRHNIQFKTFKADFANRAEARNWIIANQFSRRNLTPEQRNYLIGKQYLERKQSHGGDRGNQYTGGKMANPQSDVLPTAEIIANEHKIGRATVERAAAFTQAIDTIAENVGDEVRDKILGREIPIPAKDIRQLARYNPEKQKEVVGKLLSAQDKTAAQLIVSSESNEWYTPSQYIEAAREVMGDIDIDPATSKLANEIVRARIYFTEKDDGLQHDWPGRVWLNPPYGGMAENFVRRLVEQYGAGITKEAILLVNSHATDTKWFQPLWDHVLCFTNHRINFISPSNTRPHGSTHGSVFVYFGSNQGRFAEIFAQFGPVVRRY